MRVEQTAKENVSLLDLRIRRAARRVQAIIASADEWLASTDRPDRPRIFQHHARLIEAARVQGVVVSLIKQREEIR